MSLPFAPKLIQAMNPAGGARTALLDTAAIIMHRHVERGRRALCVCAPASGAGVSFISAALGIALAEEGVQTLLLDANLHRPSIQDLIAPSLTPQPGLLQVLRGEVDDVGALVQHEVAPGLSILPAGGVTDQANDLFDTERFAQCVRACVRDHTLTIIDAPPANRCAETRRVAAVAGYAILVARQNITMADDMVALEADLRRSRVELIGTVLNQG